MSPRPRIALVAVAALIGVGCGGSDDDEPESGATGATGAQGALDQGVSKVATIPEAIDELETIVDVPVSVPQGLPDDTPATVRTNDGGAELSLIAPSGVSLLIQYGQATFDGCEPPAIQETDVNGAPAVVGTSKGGSKLTTIIWPATRQSLQGEYGISAAMDPAQVEALATSMATAQGSPSQATGC